MTCFDCLQKGLPKQGNLLVNVRRTLQSINTQGNSYKATEELKDSTGRVYAVKMLAPSGLPFVLIAKGSSSLGEIISTQKQLLTNWKGPLVLAWKRGEDVNTSFLVFDADAVLREKAFENSRFGVEMVNFSLRLGRPWRVDFSLDDVWMKLRVKRKAVLTSFCEVT